ncbi:sugar phosphate isomerase/epimerase family protein [Blastomonas sp.]|uniref:sugar phosphate isomerase/epimerase family protein n=1 Tax=Blastomonas sp. TaxID=1909299 RepID=UPI003593C604
MSDHLLSLASGVLPEFTPEQTAAAAVAAGWPAVGIWVEPATWTSAIAADVRRRVEDAGVIVLDVEVIWLKPGADDPDHLRIIDAGEAIGARNVLVVSSDPDPQATADKLARLVKHAASAKMRVCLEFAAFTEVKSLAAALDIIARSHSDTGLLIDPLHFARTGATPDMLRGINPHRLPYAQFCDAAATGPAAENVPAIIEEALDLRLDVGQGALPLKALLDTMPAQIPLSIELRSKALRDAYGDPDARAAALLAATRQGLQALSG